MTSRSIDKSRQKNLHCSDSSSSQVLDDRVSFRDWVGVLAAAGAAFMAMFALMSVAPAMDDISGDLGVPVPLGAWVVYAALTAQIVAVPLAGFFSQVFSTRRYFLVNTCLFLVFSVACSFATNLPTMIVLRATQGLMAGGLSAIAIATIVTKLPPSKRPIGLALYGISNALAPGIAPVSGGWITYHYSWHYVFYITLIPGILVLAAAYYGLKPEPMKLQLLERQDWLGVILFIVALVSFEYVIQDGTLKNWFDYLPMVYFSIIALVCTLLFVAVELNRQHSLVNLRLLGQGSFALSILITTMYGFAQGESLIILVFYAIPILDYNAIEIGEVIAAYGFPQVVTTPLAPKLMQRFDPRAIASIGLIGYGISFWMNVNMTHQTAIYQLIPSLIVRGLAQPFVTSPLSSIVTSQLEKKDSRDASILFSAALFISMTIGIAFLKEFQSDRTQFHASHINEAVSLYNSITLERINELTQYFLSQGGGEELARNRAISVISGIITRESSVMGFADCYYVIGWVLIVAAGLVFLVRKPRSS